MMTLLENIDITLFYLINRTGQNAVFDVFMPFMSNIKNFYFPIAAGLAVLILRRNIRYRTLAVFIILLICFSEWVSSDLLKPAFGRPRPYHSLSNVHKYERMERQKPISERWHITPELKETIRGQSLSLPSSHATNIFAAAFFLSFYLRKFWPFFYLIACIVGYSRVYLGVHFPFDVLAGAMAGTLCGLILTWPTDRAIRFLELKFARRP